MQANSTSKSFNVDGSSITQWFAPTDKGEDLDYARKLINGAEQGILFLFFNPGAFEPDDEPERPVVRPPGALVAVHPDQLGPIRRGCDQAPARLRPHRLTAATQSPS